MITFADKYEVKGRKCYATHSSDKMLHGSDCWPTLEPTAFRMH